jgi:hypothetical protein
MHVVNCIKIYHCFISFGIIYFLVQAKTFFVAEMMCKQLIFCVKAATRLATGATQPYVYVDQLSLIFDCSEF